MATRGRKPTRSIKMVEPVAPPECPAFASPRAKEFWAWLVPQMAAEGMVAKPDVLSLALLCEALATFWDARGEQVKGSSKVTVGRDGNEMERKRPCNDVASDAWRRAFSAVAEFGLTPVARKRLEIELQNGREPDRKARFFA